MKTIDLRDSRDKAFAARQENPVVHNWGGRTNPSSIHDVVTELPTSACPACLEPYNPGRLAADWSDYDLCGRCIFQLIDDAVHNGSEEATVGDEPSNIHQLISQRRRGMEKDSE
jgi:hypothetical protein